MKIHIYSLTISQSKWKHNFLNEAFINNKKRENKNPIAAYFINIVALNKKYFNKLIFFFNKYSLNL